ncbi:hypothetical protein TNCV_3356981 [Trichonephila clavipes]|nr:hypothetical protein TNCV_3356981 [Trichonephila clavipes]
MLFTPESLEPKLVTSSMLNLEFNDDLRLPRLWSQLITARGDILLIDQVASPISVRIEPLVSLFRPGKVLDVFFGPEYFNFRSKIEVPERGFIFLIERVIGGKNYSGTPRVGRSNKCPYVKAYKPKGSDERRVVE